MNTGARPIYVFAGFSLDAAGGILRNGRAEVALRPKSFELLAYLVRNAGRVIPKAELMDAVWPDVTVTEDSLTQCVSDVRRVLADSDQKLVRTVPRRGYLFASDVLERAPGTAHPPTAIASVLTDRPSVAVLPFADPQRAEDELYFSDGLVEEIITSLSRFRRLFVIAHGTALAYAARNADAREVGSELGVRYVLIGTIRRAANRFRVNVQLIDAGLGTTLWAEHYDSTGKVDALFDLQDRISGNVVGAMVPQLLAREMERSVRKRPDSVEAYDLYLRALSTVRKMTQADNDATIALATRALDLDPNYAVAAGLAAWGYSLRVAQGWQADRIAEADKGVALGRHAVSEGTASRDAEALAMGGYAVAFLGHELREGLRALDTAIEINPSSALAFGFAGWIRTYRGEFAAAVDNFEMAMQLSPRDQNMFRTKAGIAFAHLLREDFGKAVEYAEAALRENVNYTPTHRVLASALGHLGRLDQAAGVVARLRMLVPGLTVSRFSRESLFTHSGRLDLILDGLRRAGLPE